MPTRYKLTFLSQRHFSSIVNMRVRLLLSWLPQDINNLCCSPSLSLSHSFIKLAVRGIGQTIPSTGTFLLEIATNSLV